MRSETSGPGYGVASSEATSHNYEQWRLYAP